MGGRLLNPPADDALVVPRRVIPLPLQLAAVACMVVAVWALFSGSVSPVVGYVAVAAAILLAWLARQRTATARTRIDRLGVHPPDGRGDLSWSGAVLVWVGRSVPVGAATSALIYTRDGIESARRDRARLRPSTVVRMPPQWAATDICTRLRQLTDVPIMDGTVIDRRAAELQVMGT